MKTAWMLIILAALFSGCGPVIDDFKTGASGTVEGTVVGKSHGTIFIQYKGDNHIGTWEPGPLVYALIPLGYTTHVHWRIDSPIVEPAPRPIGYGAPVKLPPTRPVSGYEIAPFGPGINESLSLTEKAGVK